MKHRIGFNRLERNAAHRKSLHRNMVTSLFKYERIETTKSKALEIRRTAEKLITRAKEDTVHNRRIAGEKVLDPAMLVKLFKEIGPRMKDRNGGYTRILKLGARQGDGAMMVILELVDYKLDEKKEKERQVRKERRQKAKAEEKEEKTDGKAEKAEAKE
jgi:large subunit ribosomal protein L17